MSQKSSEMKAQGIDVINMSVGEPDFNTPEHIKEAAKEAVDNNCSSYSPVPGYPDLRKSIVAKLKNENGLDYSVSEILVGNGAKQCVCNAYHGIGERRRRSDYSCSLLGELSADGEVGWWQSRFREGWLRAGFQDDSLNSWKNAITPRRADADPLLTEQSDGKRVY